MKALITGATKTVILAQTLLACLLYEFLSADEDYRRITNQTKLTGSADYYRGVQGTARIRTERGEFSKALQTLRSVELDQLRGYWRGSMYRSLGDTLNAAGREGEAVAAYREVLDSTGASSGDRKAAEDAIRAIEKQQ